MSERQITFPLENANGGSFTFLMVDIQEVILQLIRQGDRPPYDLLLAPKTWHKIVTQIPPFMHLPPEQIEGGLGAVCACFYGAKVRFFSSPITAEDYCRVREMPGAFQSK